jgi:hypothetical protein
LANSKINYTELVVQILNFLGFEKVRSPAFRRLPPRFAGGLPAKVGTQNFGETLENLKFAVLGKCEQKLSMNCRLL